LLITAIVERRLKNIDEFVGFNNLQTVRFCLGWTIANAKCFLFKFTAGSTIAKPEPKSEGIATGSEQILIAQSWHYIFL